MLDRIAHKYGLTATNDNSKVHNILFKPPGAATIYRAEKSKLLKQVSTALDSADCVYLCGEAGSGKSQLAAWYAYKSLKAADGSGHYRQILWVDASRLHRYSRSLRLFCAKTSLIGSYRFNRFAASCKELHLVLPLAWPHATAYTILLRFENEAEINQQTFLVHQSQGHQRFIL